jgi:predicted DNA-binding transcriptional regulator YafY
MTGEDVMIEYTNHRGEHATRRIRPVRIWYGSTEWHRSDQWLLEAHDYARSATRNFAMAEITSWAKERRAS